MAFHPRADWTTEPNQARPVQAPQTHVYLHYPGQPSPIGRVSDANTAARLRGYRRMHTSGQYREIAYNWAVDQSGGIWELRGDRQSGANGGTSSNRTGQAILLLVGNTEEPTAEMVHGVNACIARIRASHPGARTIRGHRQSPDASTDCPGAPVTRLIAAGAFTGGTTPAAPPPVQAVTGLDWAQSTLAQLGFDPGPIDGQIGPRTREATTQFQTAAGITADGIPGPTTRAALEQTMTIMTDILAEARAIRADVATVHNSVNATPSRVLTAQVKRAGGRMEGSTSLAAMLAWNDNHVIQVLDAIRETGAASGVSDEALAAITDAVARVSAVQVAEQLDVTVKAE